MVARSISRRSAVAAVGTFVLTASAAQAGSPLVGNALDGTWGGVDARGETAQVIVTGGEAIGFFWRGDYTAPAHSRMSQGGLCLDFTFPGGAAALVRTAAGAMLTIREPGKGTTHSI